MLRVKFSKKDFSNDQQLEFDFRDEIQIEAEHNAKIMIELIDNLRAKLEAKKKTRDSQEKYTKQCNSSNSSPNKILSVNERLTEYNNQVKKLEKDLDFENKLFKTMKEHYLKNHNLEIIYEGGRFKSKYID